MRWGLLAMSSGQDVRFSEDKVAQGLQLTNKLWNAARLILLGVDGDDARAPRPRRPRPRTAGSCPAGRARRRRRPSGSSALTSPTPRWRVYDFVYGELCDWYLELVKPRLRAREPALAPTLLHVLTETVALAHPLIPFETEEIYSHIPGAEGLLAARVGARTDAAEPRRGAGDRRR